jgi:hypothetical protein
MVSSSGSPDKQQNSAIVLRNCLQSIEFLNGTSTVEFSRTGIQITWVRFFLTTFLVFLSVADIVGDPVSYSRSLEGFSLGDVFGYHFFCHGSFDR